jgi:gliding-associated putative ABC transporter substrate-binding component GldG
LILGILIVVNFLSYQIFLRLDLTQGKIYSLADASKKTAGNLTDIVSIKAYFSSNLPNEFITVRQEVEDLLAEYKAYSNGKIKIEFIDPGDNEEMKRDLYMEGIPQLTFQVLAKDKAQTMNGYMGIEIKYGDKTEIIPAVKQDTSDLEYQLTTAIKKATAKEIATIGYITSQKTLNPDSEFKTGLAALSELYNVKEITLNGKDIPSHIKTLVIAGPKDKFSENDLKAIEKFLSKGGSLFIMLDGVNVDQNMQTQKNTTNIDQLLSKYGIIINKDLVADTRNSIATFNQGYMSFSVEYPYWVRLTKEGFNRNNSLVSSLENVTMPWASSIDIDESKIDRNSVTNLAFTTDKAWENKDNFNISPTLQNVNMTNQGKYTLAVEINGKLKNAYPDATNKEFNGHIIAVGDSDFASESFIRNSSDNQNLFLNLIDGLSLDSDLVNIRAKNISSRPIKDLTDGEKAAIRYINVFSVTIIVVGFGLARYYLRRRSKFIDNI